MLYTEGLVEGEVRSSLIKIETIAGGDWFGNEGFSLCAARVDWWFRRAVRKLKMYILVEVSAQGSSSSLFKLKRNILTGALCCRYSGLTNNL